MGPTERLRLHRRTVQVDGREYQVLSLRGSDAVRFSVEVHPFDHAYPLIRSDLEGARLLGRLLWGLSYQRHPDTVLVLDPGHLVCDPHDGARSPIVVLAVATRTVLVPALIRRLRQPAVWRTPSQGAVSWNTAGLPAAVTAAARRREARRLGDQPPRGPDLPEPLVHQGDTALSVLAGPELLRNWAVSVVDVGSYWYAGESCTEPSWGESGIDVHAVADFAHLVTVATAARAEVLAAPDCPTEPEEVGRRVREALAAGRPGAGRDER